MSTIGCLHYQQNNLQLRVNNCSYTSQHYIKFVLKIDLTVVEVYTVAFQFVLDTCQIKM